MLAKKVVRGATFAASGVLSYATSNWSAFVIVDEAKSRAPSGDYGISVSIVPIGLSAGSTTHTDYLVSLTASAATTATWRVNGFQDALELLGRVFLRDPSGHVVATENRFTLKVEV